LLERTFVDRYHDHSSHCKLGEQSADPNALSIKADIIVLYVGCIRCPESELKISLH
jgi:hypothetical protein